ncbi:hypothetical protein ACUULL_000017 [Vibrio cholerae]|uniref:hypothetical protein n=1 Tax=Vibrio cholerae TaxID=666 RepID=UPI0028B3D052|nr:hypothetical protein [Vibrio cholerae]EJB0230107.1 hypothetical protein [Vibrio vulnificus]EKF9485876.1 hypothetical protein [Vibrio cholerae]ELP3384927.1 hypothetical protein [Vibrio cholerae]ELP3388183.1 hypothetical protein [Vibrio cholerae]ELR9907532.1 hypothetical protein [Vibrio cholerae]
MCKTFQCRLDDDHIVFSEGTGKNLEVMSLAEFDKLIPRRQRPKLSMATKMAYAIFNQYAINLKLKDMGADPKDTPMVICNRFANWDYVADAMSSDIATTINNVSNYVATAWFPATVQGFLTIENGNRGEAVTLATQDTEMLLASIESLFDKGPSGQKQGALIFGTFECLPKEIGGQAISGRSQAFGAISLLSGEDTSDTILAAINKHQEIYQYDNH